MNSLGVSLQTIVESSARKSRFLVVTLLQHAALHRTKIPRYDVQNEFPQEHGRTAILAPKVTPVSYPVEVGWSTGFEPATARLSR